MSNSSENRHSNSAGRDDDDDDDSKRAKEAKKACKKRSIAIVSDLPSRNIDYAVKRNNEETPGSNLRRRESQYHTLKLKNASLVSRDFSIDAEKIYEILSAETDASDEDKLKTLREMKHSLTIKRQVKQHLDADKKRKIETRSVGRWKRYKLELAMGCSKFIYELRNKCHYLDLWRSSIKEIQGKFGSSVASYFIFLRWLLLTNVLNFIVVFFFLLIPQLVFESRKGHRYIKKEMDAKNSSSFDFHNLITGSGWFTNSLLYFGTYSNEVLSENTFPYSIPMAYFATMGINFLINLVAVSTSITASYRKTYVHMAGQAKNIFCNKLFSAWDYSIETESAAKLHKIAFCVDIKELLAMQREKHHRTPFQSFIQKALVFIVCLFSLLGICAVGYLIHYVLLNKTLQVDIKILKNMTLPLTVTFISSFSYIILNYASKLEMFLSKKTRLYLTMIRIVTLRALMLAVIVYFWMAIYNPPRIEQFCYETEVGKEIYRLIVVNFLFNLVFFILIGEFVRKIIVKYCFPSWNLATFDVALNNLDLIYYQTLAWIGAFALPLAPLMLIVVLVLLFYIKKWSTTANCTPPSSVLSIHEAQTFYLTLTFIMFLLAAVSVTYFLFWLPPSECGPLGDFEDTSLAIKSFISKNSTLSVIFEYIMSTAVMFTVFCVLCLVVYHMRAKAKAHMAVIEKVREQLILASKDKVFLLKLYDEALQAQSRQRHSRNNNSEEDERAGSSRQSSSEFSD